VRKILILPKTVKEWLKFSKFVFSNKGEEMTKLDEKSIEVMLQVRDHPAVKEASPSLHLAVKDLLDELTDCLREKTEKCKQAHEGYIIWKARSLNYAQIIMDMRRRKAVSDRK